MGTTGFAIGKGPELALHPPWMKSLTEHLWFEVPQRRGYLNITGTVEELVGKNGVKDGLCLVNARHRRNVHK